MRSNPSDPGIRVQYVADCPHWQLAAERARAALTHLGHSDVIVDVETVASIDEAQRLAFHGSPTVLVNGEEPFPDPESAIGLSCRRYLTEDGIEGAPSVRQLITVLAGFTSAQ